jgi:MerR family transcriptional regulator, light-induced transcriptional regulator
MRTERKQVTSRSLGSVNRFCLPNAERIPDAFRGEREARGPLDRTAQRRAFLTAAIETEIIPRLAEGLRTSSASLNTGRQRKRSKVARGFDPSAVSDFAGMVLTQSASALRAHVDGLLQQGHDIESLYLHLLTPAARRLGVMWEEDSCSFVDVTIGLGSLHRLMRDLLPGFHKDSTDEARGLSVLLAPAPGDQHTFGLSMVAEFFRRSGWDVESDVTTSSRDLTRIVAQRPITLVGFSTSCTDRLEELTATIAAVRRNSRNPAIGVIVGGQAFLTDPGLVSKIGADAMAADGVMAPLQAQLLVTRLQQHNRR